MHIHPHRARAEKKNRNKQEKERKIKVNINMKKKTLNLKKTQSIWSSGENRFWLMLPWRDCQCKISHGKNNYCISDWTESLTANNILFKWNRRRFNGKIWYIESRARQVNKYVFCAVLLLQSATTCHLYCNHSANATAIDKMRFIWD